MEPTLRPNTVVVASGMLAVKKGSLVIAKKNGIEIIKRVDAISGEKLSLIGDNIHRAHNAEVHRNNVIGVVLFHV